MAIKPPNPRFSDVQLMLDSVLERSTYAQQNPPISQHPPRPHGIFWRQTGDYNEDYKRFTTGNVPNVGIPIMNTTTGQELQSNFFVILTNPNGLEDEGIAQMPGGVGGPYVTEPNYVVTLSNGTVMTGADIAETLAFWLTNGHSK